MKQKQLSLAADRLARHRCELARASMIKNFTRKASLTRTIHTTDKAQATAINS